jgi:hypothetical protein
LKFVNLLFKFKKIRKVNSIKTNSQQEIETLVSKCSHCDRCWKCEYKIKQDENKTIVEKDLELKINTLNYFVLFLFTIAVCLS